jgi:hypothetical protein
LIEIVTSLNEFAFKIEETFPTRAAQNKHERKKKNTTILQEKR